MVKVTRMEAIATRFHGARAYELSCHEKSHSHECLRKRELRLKRSQTQRQEKQPVERVWNGPCLPCSGDGADET